MSWQCENNLQEKDQRCLWNSRQYVQDYSLMGRNMLRRSSEDITKHYRESIEPFDKILVFLWPYCSLELQLTTPKLAACMNSWIKKCHIHSISSQFSTYFQEAKRYRFFVHSAVWSSSPSTFQVTKESLLHCWISFLSCIWEEMLPEASGNPNITWLWELFQLGAEGPRFPRNSSLLLQQSIADTVLTVPYEKAFNQHAQCTHEL